LPKDREIKAEMRSSDFPTSKASQLGTKKNSHSSPMSIVFVPSLTQARETAKSFIRFIAELNSGRPFTLSSKVHRFADPLQTGHLIHSFAELEICCH
jgi:hypothetical protein